jgi:signal transduction histidine kinase
MHDASGSGEGGQLLLSSVELLQLAEEAGRLGLFEWHVQVGTLRVSPGFLALHGLTEFDGRYESWLKCIFREDLPRFNNLMESSFAAHAREMQTDFRIVPPDGGALMWMEARSLIFYDAKGEAVRVVGVNVDVTDKKRDAAQLRAFTETLEDRVRERTRELEAENEARTKAEELLRQSQKMEVVGQLTGGVAHDFNNLLTIIQGGLDMIGRQMPGLDPSPAAARIARAKDMALEGVRRAARLTDRLLAFARQQPLDPTTIDANRLVSGICELLRRTVGESTQLETVLAAGLWLTNADANQLENAVLNLIINARDALPNGGKVTIETANCYLDEAYVSELAEPVKPGQYVMVAVADNGTGMDQSTLQRAFEPFFTTKGVGKGTGHGHVAVYSELGNGTTIKIYLPRHLGKEDRDKVLDLPRADNLAIGIETVLVVEDDDTLRLYTVESLNELGYGVLAAPHGAAALALIDGGHEIDLLFTDIVMPGGMNGRQLADEAVRRRPGLKVLFTTGYTRNAIVHHGRLDPDVQLIGKPFTFSDLGKKVRALLDEKDK